MRTLRSQRGIGWFGLLWIFASLAIVAICVIKIGPLYLNEMNVARAVKAVADDPEMANAEPNVIREALTRRWDADYIDESLMPKQVRIKRTQKGRALSYDYEGRVNLFYNIYVVIEFQGEEHMRTSRTS